MIAKEDLSKFIKEAVKEGPFDGCMYVDLDCADEDSNELYLVFACDEEGDALCKIAYNCDDLQCGYDWDWAKPEELDYECYGCQDWADSYCDKAAEWIADYILAEKGE